MKLKIGRHEYEITSEDRFLDNGACVQLLTQSKEKADWGGRPSPVLSKRAVKEISKLNQAEYNHNYPDNCRLFGLDV